MASWVVRRTDIFHFVDATAFGAALDGAFARGLEIQMRWVRFLVDDRGTRSGEGEKRRRMGRERMEDTYGQPFDSMRISGAAGAAAELFVAKGFDHDGVIERSCHD